MQPPELKQSKQGGALARGRGGFRGWSKASAESKFERLKLGIGRGKWPGNVMQPTSLERTLLFDRFRLSEVRWIVSSRREGCCKLAQ